MTTPDEAVGNRTGESPSGGQLPAANAFVADVRSHYDELHELYLRIWGEHIHHGLWAHGRETKDQAVLQLLELVAVRGDIRPGALVCDIGSGYGATGRWLWERSRAIVTGYTVSTRQHAHALLRRPPEHRYVLRDWLVNDEPDGWYDGVIAIESTEHMPDRLCATAEAYRVLRAGGRFVVAAWLSAPRARRWQARYVLDPIRREGLLAAALPTQADWHATLIEAGFTDVTTDLLGASVRRTWTLVVRGVLAELARGTGWSYLFDKTKKHRRFAITVLRMWLAYRIQVMDYAVMSGRKA